MAARAATGPETIKAYAVVDDKTGHVLASSKPTDKLQIGSLTKIATAIVVLDWARLGGHGLEQTMTVPPAALAAGGENPVGFQPGDQLTIRDLLYAALLQSDNVAAEALAYNVGNDLPDTDSGTKGGLPPMGRFIVQMNALAKHLGMTKTRFLNPDGLDSDKVRPYSTASDMARLTRAALTKSDFRFFVAQKDRKITINRAGVASEYLLRNTNDLLGVHNVDGVKTGRTARAGSCLIITAARESIVKVKEGGTSEITPRRLIVVLLGSPDRSADGARLLEQGEGLYDQWAAQGRLMDPKNDLDSAGQ